MRSELRSLRVGIGQEFAGRLLDQYVHLNKVKLDFDFGVGHALSPTTIYVFELPDNLKAGPILRPSHLHQSAGVFANR